jgi:hypothetical protein
MVAQIFISDSSSLWHLAAISDFAFGLAHPTLPVSLTQEFATRDSPEEAYTRRTSYAVGLAGAMTGWYPRALEIGLLCQSS